MINKVTLLGNVGKDPEVRTTTTGKQVTSFSLATTEKYKDTEKTSWHKVVSWSQSASKIKKGDKLYIEGKIDYRTWDKPDGSKGYATDIVAQLFLFMNPRQDAPANHGGNANYNELAPPPANDPNDFLPFP